MLKRLKEMIEKENERERENSEEDKASQKKINKLNSDLACSRPKVT